MTTMKQIRRALTEALQQKNFYANEILYAERPKQYQPTTLQK